jgi:hypothetical protein
MADKKKLTERQQALIDALMGEAQGNIRVAMDMAGYSPNTRVMEAIKPIRDEVVEAASMMIAMNSPLAAGAMIGVLHNPEALGAKNTIAAAKEVMDRAGLVKKDKIEIEATGGGMFILPPKAND